MEQPIDVVRRYLQDCIAAERNFESQLRAFSQEGEQDDVKRLFAQHADETRHQYERLEGRLRELGGTPSAMRSFIAHLFGFAPKTASLGHEDVERSSQDLMVAYSVERAEEGMYEALATVASAAGDTQTEQLARSIQQEERATAGKVWSMIAPSVRDAFNKLTGRKTLTA